MGIDLVPGSEPVAGYRLINRLGRGGFGEVWKAEGPGGFKVALKFVALAEQAGPIELRALEVIRNICHPHLLTAFGAWQVDQHLIIAMELAERTLLDRFHEATGQGFPGIPAPEIFEHFLDAAKGLDYLNEPRHPADSAEPLGIQHRDVKPQNLLLIGGSVKVADFGLARVLSQTHTSHSGSMTPAYAAPEFFQNRTSGQSDQYSLAVTYCHLRGGRLPFVGDFAAIMVGHLQHEPDLSMLPGGEQEAVARALAKDPKERWPSSRAFVEAVRCGGPASDRPALATQLPKAAGQHQSTAALFSRPCPPVPAGAVPPSGQPTLDASSSARSEPVAPGSFAETTWRPDPRPHGQPFELADRLPVPRAGRPLGRREVVAWSLLALLLALGLALWSLGVRVPGERPAEVAKAPSVTPHPDDVGLKPAKEVEAEPETPASPARASDLTSNPSTPPPAAESLIGDTAPPSASSRSGRAEAAPANEAEAKPSHPESESPGLPRRLHKLTLDVPAALTLVQGAKERLLLKVSRDGFEGPVALRFEGLPDGVTIRGTTIPAGETQSEVGVEVGPATRVGDCEIKIIGTGGTTDAAANLRITVEDDVISGYSKKIRLDPKDAWAYLNRGNAWKAKEEYDKALADYDEAIRLDPKYAWAYNSRGNAWYAKQAYDKARADLDEAIRLDPKLAPAYNGRGRTWADKGEYDKALADFDEAIHLDPKLAKAYLNRGAAWGAKRDPDKALADFDEAIRLDPKLAPAYLDRGLAWADKKEYDKALADYDEVIRLDPKLARAYLIRGNTWKAKKEYDKALADYDEAIRLDPKNALAYNGRVWLWATCPDEKYRDDKKAVESATRACELTDWKVANDLDTLAAAYAEAGDFDTAIKWEEKALELLPQDDKRLNEFRARLDLYKQKKPYRLVRTRAGVIDRAGLFSPEAARQAEAKLDRVERDSHVTTTIETIDSLQGEPIHDVIIRNAERSGTEGIYILIPKQEHKIDILVSRPFLRALPGARRDAIREAFIKGFERRDFDGGLRQGVQMIEREVAQAKADCSLERFSPRK